MWGLNSGKMQKGILHASVLLYSSLQQCFPPASSVQYRIVKFLWSVHGPLARDLQRNGSNCASVCVCVCRKKDIYLFILNKVSLIDNLLKVSHEQHCGFSIHTYYFQVPLSPHCKQSLSISVVKILQSCYLSSPYCTTFLVTYLQVC